MTGLGTVGVEVWMAGGYCLALVALAYAVDQLARRAASVAEGGAAGGFVYHADHDAWQCPEDQWLWPQSFDPENRVMRYRASPTVCNACPVKQSCTTSPSGREVQRTVDSWPASEAARFHRAIACVVVLLGLVWPVAIAVTSQDLTSRLVLGATMAVAIVISLPLYSHLRRNRAFVPEGMTRESLDETIRAREREAAMERRRRSRYGSDRRTAQGGGSW